MGFWVMKHLGDRRDGDFSELQRPPGGCLDGITCVIQCARGTRPYLKEGEKERAKARMNTCKRQRKTGWVEADREFMGTLPCKLTGKAARNLLSFRFKFGRAKTKWFTP
mmetsp:Transcript_41707/g.82326  ORF Transcript_41707/g.82326 Transcript_41707/m.82326 type:complete len:109 (+) Transcript_41707:460-786(+)